MVWFDPVTSRNQTQGLSHSAQVLHLRATPVACQMDLEGPAEGGRGKPGVLAPMVKM